VFRAYKYNGVVTDELTKEIGQLRNHMISQYLILIVYATIVKARKVGFKETGRIPKEIFKDGKYIDHIIMTLEL
jgi:L-amino acid N-acyltransferase YncA